MSYKYSKLRGILERKGWYEEVVKAVEESSLAFDEMIVCRSASYGSERWCWKKGEAGDEGGDESEGEK